MPGIGSKTAVSNFIWRFLERCGAHGIAFIVYIILARLLEPEMYGTVALITVITSILQVFIDSGFGNALIQKKDADDLDFSSVFWFNMGMCVFLYLCLFIAAPGIARFYGDEGLTPLVRATGLILIISGIKNIQQSYVSRNLLFKKFFFATLGGTVGAAVIGIWMAYNGYGVWALVAQNLFNAAVDTLILWITVKWRPEFRFSFERLKGLFMYGWKLLASSLLDTVYGNIRSLIIGKKYTTSDLAYYDKGGEFPKMIVVNINAAIDSVLLPIMSAEQDNRERVRAMTRRAIKTGTYIIMPLMTGFAVCSEPVIRILIGEKWLPAVFFLRIFCVTYAFYPIHTANLNAIKAMGRSDMYLKLEIIKKIVGLIAVIITMFISVKAMAISLLVTSLTAQIINSWPNRKLLDYRYADQVKDMLPQIGVSCLMGGIVYCFTFLGLNDYITLVLQVTVGAVIYIGCSALFRIEAYEYCMNMLKNFIPKRKTAGKSNGKKTAER